MTPNKPITLQDVKQALERDEFSLEYLPTIDLITMKCIGCEALLRWKINGVNIPPGLFIPIVEKTPLSGPLTFWVIEQFAKELGSWLLANPQVHLSFNVPPEVLGRGAVDLAIKKEGLMPVSRQLIVEVTERGLPDDIGVQSLEWHSQDDSNWMVAMDDVGTGGANLVVLARVPANYLKLDKSMVDQLRSGSSSKELALQVMLLAQHSQGKIIAEGIEHADQLEVLQELNIPFGQGWYFSKSVPAKAFLEYYANHC